MKIIKWVLPKNPFLPTFFENGKYPKARAAEGQSSTGKVNPPVRLAYLKRRRDKKKRKEEKERKEKKRREKKIQSMLSNSVIHQQRRCAVEPERSEGEARSAGDHARFFSCHGSRKNFPITVTQIFC